MKYMKCLKQASEVNFRVLRFRVLEPDLGEVHEVLEAGVQVF